MRRRSLVLLSVLALPVLWGAAALWREPPPDALFETTLAPASLGTLPIAAPAEALTLARAPGPRLLRVESWVDGVVSGTDLTASLPGAPTDAIIALAAHGHAHLGSVRGPAITVPAETLLAPFEGRPLNPAVGTNYPAHGGEVDVDEPFLFPKRTAPTAPRGPIAAGDRLLDHEVELGFVALAPIRPGTAPRFGLVLVGDYTDRAALLRELDIGDVASGRGFGTAKSFPGALPVGPLLVVPEDPQAFYRRLRLELFVNGRKRQQAEPHRMLWDLDRILVEMFRAPERRWLVAGHATGLGLEDGALPPGAILLSGTADGVIFRPPSTRQIALGIVGMAASLDWRWPGGMFEPAIREWRADRRYLQPGDVVVMRADFLGVIRNEVAP